LHRKQNERTTNEVKEPHQSLPPPPGGSLLLCLPQLLVLLSLLPSSDHRPHPHHPAPFLHTHKATIEQSTANEGKMLK